MHALPGGPVRCGGHGVHGLPGGQERGCGKQQQQQLFHLPHGPVRCGHGVRGMHSGNVCAGGWHGVQGMRSGKVCGGGWSHDVRSLPKLFHWQGQVGNVIHLWRQLRGVRRGASEGCRWQLDHGVHGMRRGKFCGCSHDVRSLPKLFHWQGQVGNIAHLWRQLRGVLCGASEGSRWQLEHDVRSMRRGKVCGGAWSGNVRSIPALFNWQRQVGNVAYLWRQLRGVRRGASEG